MITDKTIFTTTTTNSATLPTKIIPTTNATKSVCSPADPLPAIKPPCTRLNETYAAYCKKHGVKLDSYVFKNSDDQRRASINFEGFRDAVEKVSPLYKTFKGSKCFNIIVTVFCHHYFPACDRTGGTTKEQKLCKATSDYFQKTCRNDVAAAQKLHVQQVTNFVRTTFPTREAGRSPECWYYDAKHNETDSSKDGRSIEDCLYLDGRGYQGNISVTSSGIPCQSWTTQCPHRHTMLSMYPELKNAFNYCRNPRASGKRPWCFTSDKNTRWEYCDIPINCLPVNGSLGNWTLNKKCNSTCGKGIEEWRRYCDAPAPRYGGKNCSLLKTYTEIRNCSNLLPCPINGNYGKWIKNSTCNATCGDGFEIWIRKCNNPTPAYSGHNCSELGKPEKLEPCVTLCPNPQTGINDLKIGISAGVTPVVLVILVIFVVFGYRRIKRKYEPYATLRFDKIISMKPMENSEDCTEHDIASVQPQTYANLDEDGEPLFGVCRGIIPYQQPYVNVTSLNRPHYSKLQLFSSITLDWLRNAWGQVDELGKHVYDSLSRGMELLLPYDELKKPKLDSPRNRIGAIDENGDEVYDKFDRRPAVLIPRDCVRLSSGVEKDEMKAEDKSLNGENIALQVLN